MIQCCFLIFLELHPQTNRSELGNTIFNIVERNFEQMKLLLPDIFLINFKTTPVNNLRVKFIIDTEPVFSTLFQTMIWIFIRPVLKFINGCNPGENRNDSFELLNFRSA